VFNCTASTQKGYKPLNPHFRSIMYRQTDGEIGMSDYKILFAVLHRGASAPHVVVKNTNIGDFYKY